jgi:hypothetical protein
MCLTKQTAVTLKDFATFADLDAWFNLHNELRMPSPNLCDDYSRDARALAEADGYFLAPELVYQGQCYGQIIFPLASDPTKPDTNVFHIADMAIVLADETHLADANTKDSSGNPVPIGTPLESCWYCDLNWNRLIYLTSFIPGGAF